MNGEILQNRKKQSLFIIFVLLKIFLKGIILICFYKAKKGQKLRFSADYGKKLLKSSWHFILPAVMVSVYGQTDKFMLKQMISDSEIGYYSTATALCSMVPQEKTTASLPSRTVVVPRQSSVR